MPTQLDISLRPVVEEMILRMGQQATLEAPRSDGAYNPSLGGFEAAPATAAAAVVATPPTPISDRWSVVAQDRAGSATLQTGDMSSIVSAKALEDAGVPAPVVGGFLVLAGQRRLIVMVDTLYSGEQVAAYQVYLRG